MSIGDLLRGLLGAAGQQSGGEEPQGAGAPLAGVLGSLLGGQPAARQTGAPANSQLDAPQAEPAGGGDLNSMFNSLVGGGQQAASQAEPAAGGDLGGLLGALLGGGQQTSSSGGGMGGLLGALLGGGGQAQQSSGVSSGMGGLLGSLLGGGQQTASSSASPIVQAISEKLGIPTAIVELIVSFVLSKLQGSMSQRGIEASALQDSGVAQSADLQQLFQQMSGDRHMAAELANQTGLDTRTAMQGMQEVLALLSSGSAG